MMEIDNVATIKRTCLTEFGRHGNRPFRLSEELRTGRLAVVPIENSSMIREINLVFPGFQPSEVLDEDPAYLLFPF